MRFGALLDLRRPVADVAAEARRLGEHGFDSVWATQIFGYDALTLLAVIGREAPGITLGTAVVPIYSRLPQVMAQQALTVQAATGGRFVLGVGLSHQVVVEGVWGLSFDRPARHLREYLSALAPMLAGEAVQFEGETVTARTGGALEIPTGAKPPLVVAALGSTTLRLAGRLADGTVTWMTGTRTVAEHIVPTIGAAAHDSGRPDPRVVVSLPVTVTSDADEARRRIDEMFARYPTLPSYRAMLEREGAEQPSDISFAGDEAVVESAVRRLAEAGATDFVASVVGTKEERERTTSFLASLAGG